MERFADLDKWAPRDPRAIRPSGLKRQQMKGVARRAQQEAQRRVSVLGWEQIDRLPSFVWRAHQCEWTHHAIERAIERNITDAEFQHTLANATWRIAAESKFVGIHGAFKVVISVDDRQPRVITVIFTGDAPR